MQIRCGCGRKFIIILPETAHNVGSPVFNNRGFGMIAHISIGVKDIGRSKRFYDAVLEPLGYRCIRAARAATG
jgi:hypothetical protein